MRNILDFIQAEVKARGGTVLQFIKDSGVGGSRSGFYRLMSEPSSLTETDKERIAAALGLDAAKEQELRHLISQSVSGYTSRQQQDICDVVFGKAYTAPDVSSQEVEFFSERRGYGSSAKNTPALIATYADILDSVNLSDFSEIKIEAKNCLSPPAQKSLCALLSELRARLAGSGARVRVEHALTVGDIDHAEKIALFVGVARIMQFRDYSIYLIGGPSGDGEDGHAAERCSWSILDNTVTVRLSAGSRANDSRAGAEGRTAPAEKHYIFHLANRNGDRDYCLEARENIYDYFRAMFNRLKSNAKKECIYATVNASKMNLLAASLDDQSKFLIKSDPCFDNISPKIWEAHMRYCSGLDGSFLGQLRSQFDPDGFDDHLDDESFFHKQISMLSTRYESNIRKGAINVFDVNGFFDFVNNGQSSEFLGVSGQQGVPPFSRELMQEQLMFMYKTVHENYGAGGAQQFYFSNLGAASALYLNVYSDAGICLQNENNEDFVNSILVVNDSQAAELLCVVVENSLPNAFVLSKEDALEFLTELFIEQTGGTRAKLNACLRDDTLIV